MPETVTGKSRVIEGKEWVGRLVSISAVILLLESTLIIGGQIIADYCGFNNCRLFNYWVEKYVVCPVTCYNLCFARSLKC